MLSVVCYLWRRAAPGGYTPAHVDRLARMVARRYRRPHRFVVVTNDPGPFADGIEVVPDACDFAALRSPEGLSMPACYRRLRLFHPDAGAIFGPRIVALDLDVVLTGDVAPLWDRPEPVVLYRDPLFSAQANGSMLLLRTGTRPHVWATFDPERSPALAYAAGYRGSDQAWISYALPDAPRWDTRDGIYSFRRHVAAGAPAPSTRAVIFHGNPKPWDAGPQRLAWVREHWGSTSTESAR